MDGNLLEETYLQGSDGPRAGNSHGEEDREWFNGAEDVGVSAGASTPEVLVQRVLAQLRDWGAHLIEERPGKTESVTFKIPRALKKATG